MEIVVLLMLIQKNLCPGSSLENYTSNNTSQHDTKRGITSQNNTTRIEYNTKQHEYDTRQHEYNTMKLGQQK